MTVKQQQQNALGHYNQWVRSNATSLSKVYKKYSRRKAKAWAHCEELKYIYNGTGLKVISHNTNIFTAGFEFIMPDTSVVMFMYITPTYDVVVEAGGN